MSSNNHQTFFASPERSLPNEIEKQREYFSQENIFTKMLDAVQSYVFVMNEHRQIVYANSAAKELVNSSGTINLFGMRVGESINCIHAEEMAAGCGTSQFCKNCGAVKSMLNTLKGIEDVQECRITTKNYNEALDLRVWTKPIEVDGQKFIVSNFVDISSEKRKAALERIFFHDVMNTVSTLKGITTLIQDCTPEEKEKYEKEASTFTDILLEEIKAQRDLSLAEQNDLQVNIKTCNSLDIINNVLPLYNVSTFKIKLKIIVDPASEEINFQSDEILLSRVLINMIKNAVESSEEGEMITILSKKKYNHVQLTVHNSGYIPVDVQQQIFQRSFSTKGKGRGLGTYSMRLLTERYLKGKIYFLSNEKEGTSFTIEIPLIFEQ